MKTLSLKGDVCRRVAIVLIPGITCRDFSGCGLTTGPGNFKPNGTSVIINLLIRAVKIPQVTVLPESLTNQNWLLLLMFIGELREMLTGCCLSKM